MLHWGDQRLLDQPAVCGGGPCFLWGNPVAHEPPAKFLATAICPSCQIPARR